MSCSTRPRASPCSPRGTCGWPSTRPEPGGAGQAADGEVPEPGGWNRFQLAVPDLDGACARLREAGVTFRSGIVQGKGGRQALAVDPAGNLVELFEPPQSAANAAVPEGR